MNLKVVSEQLSSVYSFAGNNISKGLKAVWRLLNLDLIENVLAPKRKIFVAVDKDSLSVVYGSRFFGKSKINAYRKYAYEWKTQDNVSRKYLYKDGQFPKPEVLASTLDLFISEAKAANAKIILSIPKAWTIYRTAEFPATVQENIHDVVSYELDRLASLQPENAYYDFKIIHQTPDLLKVAVAAARMDLMDSYLKVIEEEGLTVEKVTTSLSVAGGLLKHSYDGNCFILLEVYPDDYEIAGIQDSAILFAHKEKFASDNVESKITAISEELNSLVEEMKKNELSPKIVFCSDEKYIETISDKITFPVHILRRSNAGIDFPGTVRELDWLAAAGCLELMSADVASFNLLSKSKKTVSRQAFRVSVILMIAALVVGALCLVAPLALEMARISEIEKQIDLRKEEFRKNEPIKNELDNILYQIRSVNDFKYSSTPKILLLKELTRILPASFWLTKLTVSKSVLEIHIRTKGSAADVIPILEASPYFKNVRLAQPGEASADAEVEAGTFILRMDIENKPVNEDNQEPQ